jgi:hypothetical protein
LLSQNVRLADAKIAKLLSNFERDRSVNTHVCDEHVGVGLPQSDKFLNVVYLLCEVTGSQRSGRVRRVLTLDAADRCNLSFLWRNQEYRVLAAILSFAIDLNRATQHDLANLRAKVLKGSPPDRMERKI